MNGDDPQQPTGEIEEPQEEQEPQTLTLADLFGDESSDNDETLPPRPIMTTRTGPTADDQDTPPAPRPQPTKPSEPPPRPRFNPTPRPPVEDPGATRVNPEVALPRRPQRDAHGRTVEEVRQQRRAQLRHSHRIATRQSAPPVRAPLRDPRPAPPQRVVIPAEPERKRRNPIGCMLNALLALVLLTVGGFVLGVAALAIGYIAVASDLPSVTQLQASQFETVFIFDANGDELYRIADSDRGNRTYVTLAQIDRDLIDATIATEDARFWENPGFDPVAIGRAVSEVILSGAFARGDLSAAGGASTITQQLVRATLLSAEERSQTSVRRKVREIILAAELNRTLSKEQVLELYLNEIYYGNRAYGIEAAAQTYFNKSAADLTLAEASLLAGLPQAPALWDPITAPEYALGRQSEVLALMVANGYVAADTAQAALDERVTDRITPPIANLRYPHFTLAVLQELEVRYGAQEIYNRGFRVYTTLRPDVQELALATLRDQRGNVQRWGANNAALVALDPQSAEVMALVGSLDYRDESISGQVNMARAPRQPGSTIKPFVYLAALERGYTPATLFWDVPTSFPNGANPPYEPKNYDNEFHGPMLLRTALANSYNIPAVKALEAVGVCDFVRRSQAWGLGLVDASCDEVNVPRDFGLALALGGGEISPLRMATAYMMLANNGRYQEPVAIRRILNKQGETVYAAGSDDTGAIAVDVSGAAAELAYLITSILSDNNARFAEFGADNLLNIPGYAVAAKTGTSGTNEFDVRDGWTIGYAPNIVTAVWVGNTDNRPLAQSASGYRTAAPIWNRFMRDYLQTAPAQAFTRPADVVEYQICADSGVLATPECGERKIELFSRAQPPLPPSQHFVSTIAIDRWTLRQVSEYCNDAEQLRVRNFNLLVSGPNLETQARYRAAVEAWLQNAGRWWANLYGITIPLPSVAAVEPCQPGTERPQAIINEPQPNETLNGFVQIGGQATAPGFAGFQLYYGVGTNPAEWFAISDFRSQPQPGGQLAIWDTRGLPQGGPVTIRLVVFGPDNPYTGGVVDRVQKEARVLVNIPEPTATPAPTATATLAATDTPEPTETALPTDTPEPTNIPQPTDEPSTDVTSTIVPSPSATSELIPPATRPSP